MTAPPTWHAQHAVTLLHKQSSAASPTLNLGIRRDAQHLHGRGSQPRRCDGIKQCAPLLDQPTLLQVGLPHTPCPAAAYLADAQRGGGGEAGVNRQQVVHGQGVAQGDAVQALPRLREMEMAADQSVKGEIMWVVAACSRMTASAPLRHPCNAPPQCDCDRAPGPQASRSRSKAREAVAGAALHNKECGREAVLDLT